MALEKSQNPNKDIKVTLEELSALDRPALESRKCSVKAGCIQLGLDLNRLGPDPNRFEPVPASPPESRRR